MTKRFKAFGTWTWVGLFILVTVDIRKAFNIFPWMPSDDFLKAGLAAKPFLFPGLQF